MSTRSRSDKSTKAASGPVMAPDRRKHVFSFSHGLIAALGSSVARPIGAEPLAAVAETPEPWRRPMGTSVRLFDWLIAGAGLEREKAYVGMTFDQTFAGATRQSRARDRTCIGRGSLRVNWGGVRCARCDRTRCALGRPMKLSEF